MVDLEEVHFVVAEPAAPLAVLDDLRPEPLREVHPVGLGVVFEEAQHESSRVLAGVLEVVFLGDEDAGPQVRQAGGVALLADPLEAALLAVDAAGLLPAGAGGLGLAELPLHPSHHLGVVPVAAPVELHADLLVQVHHQPAAGLVGPVELLGRVVVVLNHLREAGPIGGDAADQDAPAGSVIPLLSAGHAEAAQLVAPEAELVAQAVLDEDILGAHYVGGVEDGGRLGLEGLEEGALTEGRHLLEGHGLAHVERVRADLGARLLGELLHVEGAARLQVVEEGMVAADIPDEHLVVAAPVAVALVPPGRLVLEDAAGAEDHLAGPLEKAAELRHHVGGHAHLAPVALVVRAGCLVPRGLGVRLEAADVVGLPIALHGVEVVVEERPVAVFGGDGRVGLRHGVHEAPVVALDLVLHEALELVVAAVVAPAQVLLFDERGVRLEQLPLSCGGGLVDGLPDAGARVELGLELVEVHLQGLGVEHGLLGLHPRAVPRAAHLLAAHDDLGELLCDAVLPALGEGPLDDMLLHPHVP